MAVKIPIVKKRTTKFKCVSAMDMIPLLTPVSLPRRHQSDRYHSVKEAWRKPKGIDNRVRRRFKGQLPMPKIGYGSDKATKFMMPNGLYKVTINNIGDLEMLVMHSKSYSAEIAHNVSARKRIEIVKRAKELKVRLTNASARLSVAES